MKQQPLQVYIPEPCPENWNQMQPSGNGRYCGQCAKTVVDFSTMSDQQVLQYLSGTQGRICGRFAADQLNAPLLPAAGKPQKPWWAVLLMPLLLLFGKSKAQQPVMGKPAMRTVPRQQVAGPAKPLNKPNTVQCATAILGEPAITPAAARQITGLVLNNDGQPVPFATVSVLPGNLKLMTDSAGRFSYMPNGENRNGKIRVEAIGYEAVETAAGNGQAPLTIHLKLLFSRLEDVTVISNPPERLYTIAGGIGYTVTRQQLKKDTLINRVFRRSSFLVYPSPAKPGSQVRVDTKRAGEFSLQLVNGNGAPLLHKAFDAVKGATVTSLALPANLARGVYYVVMTDEQTRKHESVKLLVQ
jgi:hypothetical protein